MIYMEPHMLGWKPVLTSWLNTLPKTLNDENKELIKDLFDRMEEALLQFVRKGGYKVCFWQRAMYALQNYFCHGNNILIFSVEVVPNRTVLCD